MRTKQHCFSEQHITKKRDDMLQDAGRLYLWKQLIAYAFVSKDNVNPFLCSVIHVQWQLGRGQFELFN